MPAFAKKETAASVLGAEEQEVQQQTKEQTDKINLTTSQMIRELGWDEQMDAPDLSKSDEHLPWVKTNPDTFEAWNTYEGWKGRRLRSKEPIGKLDNGRDKFMWIKVTNVFGRFLGVAPKVEPGDKKDFKPEKVPYHAEAQMAVAMYIPLDPENPDKIKLNGNGTEPYPASSPCSVLAKWFQTA